MLLDDINDRIENLQGNIGIYYMDLSSGNSCFTGNCDVFPSAGIAKFLVLIEVFRQLEQGLLHEDDIYVWDGNVQYPETKTEDVQSFGVLRNLHVGLELTIGDLIQLMMVVSDNLAFNILLEKLGVDSINKTLEQLGMQSCRIRRFFFENDKKKQGIDNCHSVRELGELFLRLYRGQLISKNASAKMLSLLIYHQKSVVIPYYFEESAPIAHQFGFDTGQIHDVGIVLSDQPFILCMSASGTDVRKAENAMRDISLLCYLHSQSLTSV